MAEEWISWAVEITMTVDFCLGESLVSLADTGWKDYQRRLNHTHTASTLTQMQRQSGLWSLIRWWARRANTDKTASNPLEGWLHRRCWCLWVCHVTAWSFCLCLSHSFPSSPFQSHSYTPHPPLQLPLTPFSWVNPLHRTIFIFFFPIDFYYFLTSFALCFLPSFCPVCLSLV